MSGRPCQLLELFPSAGGGLSLSFSGLGRIGQGGAGRDRVWGSAAQFPERRGEVGPGVEQRGSLSLMWPSSSRRSATKPGGGRRAGALFRCLLLSGELVKSSRGIGLQNAGEEGGGLPLCWGVLSRPAAWVALTRARLLPCLCPSLGYTRTHPPERHA